MEFEGRAARRPLPRQMDVSDWNVDTDVRSGVSSSLSGFHRDRPALDARSITADVGRRLSSGEELRSDVRNVLRPVNRYDSIGELTRAREEPTVTSSSWRMGEPAVRTSAPSYSRPIESLTEREPSSHRLQPRSIPDTRRIGESSRPSYLNREADELGARLSAIGATREPVRRGIEASRAELALTRRVHATDAAMDYSPPREQYRRATPPSTVRSDASTALTSSPFTPSVTDTPPSLARSILRPPYSPSSDDTSSRDSLREPTPLFPELPTRRESPPPSVAASSVVGDDPEPSSTVLDSARSLPSASTDERSTNTTTASVTSPPTEPVPPRQQREQLYAFRRDMRQVFARVDEMVDLHRDMFKCDVLSGLPAYNQDVAREITSFASDTFEQLTKLRERFEHMTIAWAQIEPPPSDSERDAPRRRRDQNLSIWRTSESRSETSSYLLSAETSPVPTIDNQSSATSESPTPSSQRDLVVRPRWDPTLSSLSNDNDDEDDKSSSTSSTPASDVCSSSIPSELPTLSRPSTASSSTFTTRPNVFEDFDKRMEEIRASLTAVSRDKPRLAPSPRSVSTRLSTISTFKPGGASCDDDDDDDDDDDQNVSQGENNARVGNLAALPWHQHRGALPATGSSSTTRHDREARLRQLLRELQTTGEHLDTAADGGSRI